MLYKIITIQVVLILFCSSCNNNLKTKTEVDIVKEYYNSVNVLNFTGILKIVDDSIIRTEGDFLLSAGKTDLYRMFQWDSVFGPKYKIIELSQDSSLVSVMFSKTCKRIEFLHDTVTVCRSLFAFDKGKISSINTTEYILFDFKKWQSRRDTLVEWIDKNHPELNGFVFDQTKEGAENYLKAIDYFINKNQASTNELDE
jgi:hypothetical protein